MHNDLNIDNICINSKGDVKLLSPSFYKIDENSYYLPDEDSAAELSYSAPELDE